MGNTVRGGGVHQNRVGLRACVCARARRGEGVGGGGGGRGRQFCTIVFFLVGVERERLRETSILGVVLHYDMASGTAGRGSVLLPMRAYIVGRRATGWPLPLASGLCLSCLAVVQQYVCKS